MFLEGSDDSQPEAKARLLSATEVFDVQSKELLRYLLFDDGYKECTDLNLNSGSKDKEIKLLKWQHLILIVNYRDTWIVQVLPASLDALPFQANSSQGTGGRIKRPR
jgi:hypothetical protein